MLLPNTRYPIEFALLLALLLSLPLFEWPKTIFWALFVIAFLVNRARSHDWGGRWDGWDTLFAVWLASPYVVAMFAGLHSAEWKGASDVVRIVSVAWLLKRSHYGESECLAMLRMVGVSTLLAELWALWDWSQPHAYEGIQLHSVGHVSHSTIYLVIALTALIAGMFSFWSRLGTHERFAAVILVVVSIVVIVLSGSRGAAAMAILIPLFLGLLWLRRTRWPLIWIAIGIGVFGVAVYQLGDDLRHKQAVALAGADSILNGRDPIWNRAWVTWRQYPMFGVGANNFKQLQDEKIRQWVEAEGKAYDPKSYRGSSHAHSIYLSTLVERGAFGLGVLLAVLVAWFSTLAAGFPSKHDSPLHWLLWCGAAAALATIVIIGFANTTLHHEHGLLAMMLLGLWLGYRNRDAVPLGRETAPGPGHTIRSRLARRLLAMARAGATKPDQS